jgi:YHS domain-containing protein
MNVDPEQAAAQVEHEGVTYSCCNPGCAKAFTADPGRYLQSA